MKRIIVSLAILSYLLNFSCRDNESISPDDYNDTSCQVIKLTLDGVNVRDTLTFNYTENKITSVQWCTSLEVNNCALEYTERRLYNESGKLGSLAGRWHVTYEYENGFRKRIVAYNNDQYHSTTTFLNYDGMYPTRARVETAAPDVRYVDLTFNASGDLVRKIVSDGNEIVLEDVNITYTHIENPLQGMLETPSYAALFFGFDDFAFYYSKHFPEQITTEFSQQNPVAPKTFIIDYQVTRNEDGQVVSARAFRTLTGQNINTHNILIDYE